MRGEKRTVGGASINLLGTQKQRVYIINPINRKVNYMHSKRSFPSRSKLRDLFSRIYIPAHRHIIHTYVYGIHAIADPTALNSKLCNGVAMLRMYGIRNQCYVYNMYKYYNMIPNYTKYVDQGKEEKKPALIKCIL